MYLSLPLLSVSQVPVRIENFTPGDGMKYLFCSWNLYIWKIAVPSFVQGFQTWGFSHQKTFVKVYMKRKYSWPNNS